MKRLRLIGSLVFLGGFAIFLSSLFFEKYHLTKRILEDKIPDSSKRELLFPKIDVMLDTFYPTSFGFVQQLDHQFESANKKQLQKYQFTESDIAGLVDVSRGNFSLSSLDSIFPESEINNYKKKVFKEYGAWLENKSFADKEDLEKAVRTVANNISQYAIVNDKGFNRYVIRDLKFTLTKSSSVGSISGHPLFYFLFIYGLCIVGALLRIIPTFINELPGIKNNRIYNNPMKNRGWLGILTGTFLILFYLFLYFYPEHLTPWVLMADPLSNLLNGGEASRFFFYGVLYTLCVLVMGIRMIMKYRHSKYHLVRTFSVMFFQLCFAFLIPEILVRLNEPYFDFKNIWPLDYSFFFDSNIQSLIQSGRLGIFMLIWGIILVLIGVPLFTYFYGKRWYCSWVCGCGALAETFGDPYRQLSDKSIKAWKIERWSVHGVLAFSLVMTAGVLYTYFSASGTVMGINTYSLREIYGVWIGAGFAGVVGTGFYPLMGNRVWCRFGCPLAAYLGIIQRFKSRFRITTNGGQCISCGNCSTYCEMGIDVRWYAQRGQNIVRSSCVGCGVCASVCPRGVLKLENGPEKNRFGKPIEIGDQGLILHS